MGTISSDLGRREVRGKKNLKKMTPYIYLVPAFLVMTIITFTHGLIR